MIITQRRNPLTPIKCREVIQEENYKDRKVEEKGNQFSLIDDLVNKGTKERSILFRSESCFH